MRNVSFAEEMRVREEEARRLAELNTAMAVERLEELERLKCEVESETARALVVEQNTQIVRLTEQLESQRIRLELTAGAQQMRAAVDEELKSTPVGTPPRAVPIEVGMVTPSGAVQEQLVTPMGRPVQVKRVFRINLTVPVDDYEAAVLAGALFDKVNGVLFVPSRVDLLPVSEWLPFSLDGRMHNVDKAGQR